ncbi:MAG: DUF2157 domain-containing protein [Prosthecobacter sp.]|uniref:DUF2157 domain-containing protein n=1 Tax=Prosthecobacter sp. TaxID=1965333 RepID=UPI0038FE77C4
MNTSHQRWLLEQLPQWERDGLLTADAARTLRERNAIDASQPGLAQIVMGSLGALLIGTGLIAVIGYNWDDFSRPVRLLFAFLPLLATQLISFRVLQRGDASAAWVRETAALLQALATGACIALVSQIYNLGGEWPDFLFWWMLLSLPLVWVLRSHAVAIFYLIAIAVWSINQVEHGKPWHDSPLIYPLLLLGLLPWWPGWPRKAPLSATVRWFMTISAIMGLASAAVFVTERTGTYLRFDFEAVLWLWTLTAAVLALFPLNQAGITESTGRKPQVVLGSLWLLGYGVAATFRDMSDDILEGMTHAMKLPWCWGLLAALAVFVLLAVRRRRWAVLSIASVALLPLIAFPFVQGKDLHYSTLLSWVFTLHLSIIGITLIVLDFTGRLGAPRLGASLLSVLIIARMADSHFSLLAKGLAFIAVGVAFLAFNIVMSRIHRRPTLAQP